MPNTDHHAENAKLKQQIAALEAKSTDLESQLRAERVRGRRAAGAAAAAVDVEKSPAAALDIVPVVNLHEIPYASIEVEQTQLAGGGFGIIYKGVWQGCAVAVKRLFDPQITEQLRAEFLNETQLLARMRHPNIVLYLGCVSKPPYLCILTEFMARGSLYHVHSLLWIDFVTIFFEKYT